MMEEMTKTAVETSIGTAIVASIVALFGRVRKNEREIATLTANDVNAAQKIVEMGSKMERQAEQMLSVSREIAATAATLSVIASQFRASASSTH